MGIYTEEQLSLDKVMESELFIEHVILEPSVSRAFKKAHLCFPGLNDLAGWQMFFDEIDFAEIKDLKWFQLFTFAEFLTGEEPTIPFSKITGDLADEVIGGFDNLVSFNAGDLSLSDFASAQINGVILPLVEAGYRPVSFGLDGRGVSILKIAREMPKMQKPSAPIMLEDELMLAAARLGPEDFG